MFIRASEWSSAKPHRKRGWHVPKATDKERKKATDKKDKNIIDILQVLNKRIRLFNVS